MTTLRRARDRMPDAALVCMDLRGTRARRAAAPAECYIVYRRLKPCVRTVCGEGLNCCKPEPCIVHAHGAAVPNSTAASLRRTLRTCAGLRHPT